MFGSGTTSQADKQDYKSSVAVEPDYVTRVEIETLQQSFNDSMEEVANLFLELQAGIANLNERLEVHNRRASHKI